MVIVYDEGFEGLLSALRLALFDDLAPSDIVSKKDYTPTLYDDKRESPTAHERDLDEFIAYIAVRLSEYAVKNLTYCYLSEVRGIEMAVYEYLKAGLKKGRAALRNPADPVVQRVEETCSKVRRECHRFYGLLRFSATNENIYYAPFEPDHNIISMIAPHFASRLRDQDWIIHDKKRGLAVFYSSSTREMTQACVNDSNISISEQEESAREMWRSYFRSIKIESRVNLALQKRFMPKRYWRHLVEKS